MSAHTKFTVAPGRINDASAALFVIAWMVGLAHSSHPGSFGFGHGFEMATIARNLVEHGTFGNPFAPALTGPTAVVPPLYPLLLATFIRVFGWPLPSALIVNIAFNAVTAALLPRAAKIFFDDALPGLIAGVLWIGVMPLMPQWDVSWTIACLLLGCVFTAHSLSRSGHPGWHGVAAGAMGGIISLLNPVALEVFLLWVGFLLVSRRSERAYQVRYGAALLMTIVVCNAPWLVRNYHTWHALVLRTNLGMTLYSSNNNCAESSLGKDGQTGCYQQTHPIASDAEAQLMQRLGEVAYDRQRTADTFAWIRSHPARFAHLTGQRIIEFWFPVGTLTDQPIYAIWAVTLLSAGGLFLMFRGGQAVAWFVLAVWVAYPLAYYVVVSSDRYRLPILWTSLLPAGYCLAVLASVVKSRLARPPAAG